VIIIIIIIISIRTKSTNTGKTVNATIQTISAEKESNAKSVKL